MPDPFKTVRGIAAPLNRANIDTDVIIRVDRLTGDHDNVLGKYALEALRYLPDRSLNPDFPFNDERWSDAKILIAGKNFGCGSSREQAVTALSQMGIRCIIAPSFGDIFYANCFQGGLLPLLLPEEEVDELMRQAQLAQGDFEVDLDQLTLRPPQGPAITFEVDDNRRTALLEGQDAIDATLVDRDAIQTWQDRDAINRPWVWL